MIKIYNIYRDRDNTNNCMPTLTAFISRNLESLKKIASEKTLFDFTEYEKSEKYILVYSPKLKFYYLNTIENFMKKSPCIKWIHIGSIK